MGLFSKDYSVFGKSNQGRVLVTFYDKDLNKDGEYTTPKTICKIADSAFKGSRIERLTIAEGCTSIGEGAFADCKNLTSVVLPDGITEIKPRAFESCSSLEEIIIPEGVTEIPELAFASCKKLKRVVLPSTIKKINGRAFHSCNSLESINLPEGLETIEMGAFNYCISLPQLNIPKSVIKIDNAFIGLDSLIELNIEANFTELEPWFQDSQHLQVVSLPDSIKKINPQAFSGCHSLKQINIPEGVESIGRGAFEKCFNLDGVVLPDSLQELGRGAFLRCCNLTKINIPKDIECIDTNTFSHCENLSEVQLNEGVLRINNGAFERCTNLKNINLPSSLFQIGESAFEATGLKKVVIPEQVVSMTKAFNDCKNMEEVIINGKPSRLGNWAFTKSEKLKSVTLPTTLTVIDTGAFARTDISQIVIPDSVGIIEEDAFRSCESLENVTLSKNLNYIEDNAFYNCENLKHIEFPEGLKEIGLGAFEFCGITELKLPESLTKIGNSAFRECYDLESVSIPGSVKVIGQDAFLSCEALHSVKLNEGIYQVCTGAFNYAPIKEIEFPSSVRVIQDCLKGCKELEVATINNPKVIHMMLFEQCKNLKVLNLPNGIPNSQQLYLGRCKNLQEINYKGRKIEATNTIKENFSDCTAFLNYAIENNKFIPKNGFVLKHTSEYEIENFYAHAKDWQSVLNGYVKKYSSKLGFENNETEKMQLTNATENLYQCCIMLGLFQNGEIGKRAKDFIEKNIYDLMPDEIHYMFGGLNTREYGYNEEFAKFFIQNYERPYETENGKDYFMHKEIEMDLGFDDSEVNKYYKNYIVAAYHDWAKVKEAYPNKTVLAHREQGSENNNLTVNDIIYAIDTVVYTNVKEGNEQLAELVGKYGYNQSEFETLQDLFEEGKQIKDEMMLAVPQDPVQDGIRYNLLAKDDPKGLVLGNITNCCQHLHNAGEDCMKYGVIAKNSGFIEFTFDDKTVGQSWVWYNEKTKQVCLDNIEVPTVWLKKIQTEKGGKNFLDCLTRLANGFKTEMERRGHEVKDVVVGAGYNDLSALRNFEKRSVDQTVLPEDYNSYSDATHAQYVIPIKEMKKLVNFEETTER